eukprot:GILJ01017376.1.p3 GENE.GILJ01017376.1~~GILJ01017376.1.p3  ORF type:complete len:309 (-),score=67.11 GILJ01017376.1:2944-3870(-)
MADEKEENTKIHDDLKSQLKEARESQEAAVEDFTSQIKELKKELKALIKKPKPTHDSDDDSDGETRSKKKAGKRSREDADDPDAPLDKAGRASASYKVLQDNSEPVYKMYPLNGATPEELNVAMTQIKLELTAKMNDRHHERVKEVKRECDRFVKDFTDLYPKLKGILAIGETQGHNPEDWKQVLRVSKEAMVLIYKINEDIFVLRSSIEKKIDELFGIAVATSKTPINQALYIESYSKLVVDMKGKKNHHSNGGNNAKTQNNGTSSNNHRQNNANNGKQVNKQDFSTTKNSQGKDNPPKSGTGKKEE